MKGLNTLWSLTFISHRLYIFIPRQPQKMELYRESWNGLGMAIVLNTDRRDISPCDTKVGIFSSDVQLYYPIMDRTLNTSRATAKMVSRTMDLTFLAFSLNVMVALRRLGSWLLLTLCRHLICHFKTYISYLFPRKPRGSPAKSKKLA